MAAIFERNGVYMNHNQAIILALASLGGEGTIKEVSDWIQIRYPNKWKDAGTALADMVPKSLGGNSHLL
ncbi:hypothetical protein [Neobacillus vireti]|uniref:hypothetical protein n=1 Tax=Neobacillus vireti TaxID=220686 RepID=UPI002FFFCEC8